MKIIIFVLFFLQFFSAFADERRIVGFAHSKSWIDTGLKGVISADGEVIVLQVEPFNVWHVQLTQKENLDLRDNLEATKFFELPEKILSDTSDGDSTELAYCVENRCHVIYEYQGEGQAAEAVRGLYKKIEAFVKPKLSAVTTISPRVATEYLRNTKDSADLSPALRLFQTYLEPRNRPPYPDDLYICYDKSSKRSYVQETPSPGSVCRPQLVWQGQLFTARFESNADQEREGYVCTFGDMTFFTSEPLNKIGVVGKMVERDWCRKSPVKCGGVSRMIRAKECVKINASSLADFNDASEILSFKGDCPPDSFIYLDSWNYQEQCVDEACFLRAADGQTSIFSILERERSLSTNNSQFFTKTRILLDAELKTHMSSPGLYCTTGSRYENNVLLVEKATLLAAVAVEEPKTETLKSIFPHPCQSDDDCVSVARSCMSYEMAKNMPVSSSQTANDGCRCLRGPVIFGCVPNQQKLYIK